MALVPTMGNLHQGHLELVRRARADRVVVSIFVNPLQFGEGEDYEAYPRTLEADAEKLGFLGVDMLFTPEVPVMYSSAPDFHTRVEVPGLSDILCGAYRPGHFIGVATVVCKLLNIIQPDTALFGEKDFQQLLIIRRMVKDLCIPVKVVGVSTLRESDGLAMSSRNSYLTPEERGRAPGLYQTLQWVREQIVQGRDDFDVLEQEAAGLLRDAGLWPDYVSVRRCADLGPPGPGDGELIVLAAANLGRARLIDNLRV